MAQTKNVTNKKSVRLLQTIREVKRRKEKREEEEKNTYTVQTCWQIESYNFFRMRTECLQRTKTKKKKKEKQTWVHSLTEYRLASFL